MISGSGDPGMRGAFLPSNAKHLVRARRLDVGKARHRNLSSYDVTDDVSGTSAGPFHLFSDVDLRTASLLIPKSFTSGGSLIVFSVTSLDQP